MADTAKGTVLKKVSTAIGKIASINGVSVSATAIETTDLDAAAKTFIAGPYDAGEVTLELRFEPDDTNHNQILTDLCAGTPAVYHIEWPDATSTDYQFTAFPTNFSPGAAVDGELTCSVTLKATGAIVVGTHS